MNFKLLACASFLVAFLGHIVLFNFVTFVFPVRPDPPKPKFYFLGPILTQKDIVRTAAKNGQSAPQTGESGPRAPDSILQNTVHEQIDRSDNPFAIRSISKPLAGQPGQANGKMEPKSTFELDFEMGRTEPIETAPITESDLNIQPYRPFQFKSP